MTKKNAPEKELSFLQAIWTTIKDVLCRVWVWALLIGLGIGILVTFVLSGGGGITKPHAQIKIEGNSYETIYNGKTRTPTWVLQLLTSDTIEKIDTSHYSFHPNPNISKNIQSQISDYEGSGFEMETLIIPTSTDNLKKIFYLSNVVPQVPEFKNGYWRKLNNYVLGLTKDSELFKDSVKIAVISGPLHLSKDTSNEKHYIKYQVIGKNRVAVPSHFFKVIYSSETYPPKNGPDIYVVPNTEISEEIPLESFLVTPDEFESMSGILLPENMNSYFPAPYYVR